MLPVQFEARHRPIILASCLSPTGGRSLANTPSSKKDAKRSAVRAQRNRSIRSSVKTKITKFRRGFGEGDDDAQGLAAIAVSALDRAVSKGVLHRNNAARRKSRLMKRLNAEAPPVVAETGGSKATRSKSTAAKTSSTRAATTRTIRTRA